MQNSYQPNFDLIQIRSRPGFKSRGLLIAGRHVLPCALGRSGIGIKHGEGDGITPLGRYSLLQMLVRTDRVKLRSSNFDWQPISKEDGWCDEIGDRNYNRAVVIPYSASHESLRRDDHLYDIILVMDHNITCHMGVGGSAIFFHLAHDDYRPTEGCVAISCAHMLWLLPRIGPETVMIIE
ncbi:MAG: L,D-transpeptidase family protein [Rhizobiaceae bacterium]